MADRSFSPTLTLGIPQGSRKPDERRIPLHPAHLPRIPADIRSRMMLEYGYGEPFGVSDRALGALVGDLGTRAEVMAASDVLLILKPQVADLEEFSAGQVLWGWPHCVQDREVTQLALDRKLTMIAFEAMYHEASGGGSGLHVFHRNNEIAGYASVLHALTLNGLTGEFGSSLRAIVMGFGATARGAVTALAGLGIRDVQVLTTREVAAVAAPIHSAPMLRLDHGPDDQSVVMTEDGPVPLVEFLAGADILVNCVLQDTDAPVTFLETDDLKHLKRGTVVVDVSCDEGMGFEWARPTTFADPLFEVGDAISYYAVDHSPSYLWRSATWEISEAVLPFIDTVMSGPSAWASDPVIDRAVEIRHGQIVNPRIRSFQHR